jgi:hypothetical protein
MKEGLVVNWAVVRLNCEGLAALTLGGSRPFLPTEEHDQLQQPTHDDVQGRHKQRRLRQRGTSPTASRPTSPDGCVATDPPSSPSTRSRSSRHDARSSPRRRARLFARHRTRAREARLARSRAGRVDRLRRALRDGARRACSAPARVRAGDPTTSRRTSSRRPDQALSGRERRGHLGRDDRPHLRAPGARLGSVDSSASQRESGSNLASTWRRPATDEGTFTVANPHGYAGFRRWAEPDIAQTSRRFRPRHSTSADDACRK